MSDEEDYGFEYSDDEEEPEDFEIENRFYNAKELLETDVEGALEEFNTVIEKETEKSKWGFEALEQIVKIMYRKGNFDEMLRRYKEMLTYVQSAVTRNHSEKSINSILEFVSSSQRLSHLEHFYEVTLDALKDAKNERLWFNTKLKLGKLWFDMKVFGRGNARLEKLLKELYRSCQREDGTKDMRKGTQLLEIYALEIQMHTETKNTKKLMQLYEKALQVKSAIPHPRIMGIIRECGGKMHMSAGNDEKALFDFYEAFKNYDEAGNPRRIQCLKYLVLAHMLSKSTINPLDSPEAMPYTNNPEIVAMTSLREAYANNMSSECEVILNENREYIMGDPFIRSNVQRLLSQVRTEEVLKCIKPYTHISLPFIAKTVSVPENELESLCIQLILDERISGHIDQVNKTLVLEPPAADDSRLAAIESWTSIINDLLKLENK